MKNWSWVKKAMVGVALAFAGAAFSYIATAPDANAWYTTTDKHHGHTPVEICHKPDTPAEKTLTVDDDAVPGHLGHGDYLGECKHHYPPPTSTTSTTTPTMPTSTVTSTTTKTSTVVTTAPAPPAQTTTVREEVPSAPQTTTVYVTVPAQSMTTTVYVEKSNPNGTCKPKPHKKPKPKVEKPHKKTTLRPDAKPKPKKPKLTKKQICVKHGGVWYTHPKGCGPKGWG